MDALYLNCPELIDLNLNSCRNLISERLLLQYLTLENVRASGCQDMLVGAIQSQVHNAIPASQSHANSTFPLAAAARDSNCSISATIPLPETELETDDEYKPKKSFLNLKKANKV